MINTAKVQNIWHMYNFLGKYFILFYQSFQLTKNQSDKINIIN